MNRYSIVLSTILLFIFSGCNTQSQKEDIFEVEIVDERIRGIIDEVKKDIGDIAILKLTIRSANRTPFNVGFDWFIAYIAPVYSNIPSSNLKAYPPIAYSYLNGTLVLIYTDSEFAVAPSDGFIHSLKAAIDKELPPLKKEGVPPNTNYPIYRYEYCDGRLTNDLSNVFRPDIIPECGTSSDSSSFF